MVVVAAAGSSSSRCHRRRRIVELHKSGLPFDGIFVTSACYDGGWRTLKAGIPAGQTTDGSGCTGLKGFRGFDLVSVYSQRRK